MGRKKDSKNKKERKKSKHTHTRKHTYHEDVQSSQRRPEKLMNKFSRENVKKRCSTSDQIGEAKSGSATIKRPNWARCHLFLYT